MFSNITTKWSTTVDDINPEDWISIYGTDIIKSQNFFKANENSGFEGVTFYYLQVFVNAKIAAIVPCFNYNIDLVNLTTSLFVKKSIRRIRKIKPSFCQLSTFVTGSYAATCEHFIEFSTSLKENEIRKISG